MDEYSTDDELAEQVRGMLIAAGAEPNDLSPLEGQRERSQRVLDRILATPRDSDTGSGHPARWIRPSLLLTAAAVAVLVFVVAWPVHTPVPARAATPPLLTITGVSPGTLPVEGEPAQQLLVSLADDAERQPAFGTGPVQRVVLDGWWASSGGSPTGKAETALQLVQRESLLDAQGTLRVVEHRGPELDQQGRAIRRDADHEKVMTEETYEDVTPGPNFIERLPTSPIELGLRLREAQDPVTCRKAPGGCLIADVVSLYSRYVVSPAHTAAILRVLAAEPSITYLGAVRDRLDRPAAAFSAAGEDGITQRILLLDPETGAYLGEEVILVESSDSYQFTPPAVLSFTALTRSERLPANPEG